MSTEILEDPNVMEVVRKNLRIAIAIKDTNASEVAKAVGLSRNAVQQFLRGGGSMSYENVLKICQHLRIPIGIMHLPEAMTEQNIRLYNALEAMPADLVDQAIKEAARIFGEPGRVPTDPKDTGQTGAPHGA